MTIAEMFRDERHRLSGVWGAPGDNCDEASQVSRGGLPTLSFPEPWIFLSSANIR